MPIIRQESLFSIIDLLEMELTQLYDSLLESVDLDSIFHALNKKHGVVRPLN